jgi:hypothetical protein
MPKSPARPLDLRRRRRAGGLGIDTDGRDGIDGIDGIETEGMEMDGIEIDGGDGIRPRTAAPRLTSWTVMRRLAPRSLRWRRRCRISAFTVSIGPEGRPGRRSRMGLGAQSRAFSNEGRAIVSPPRDSLLKPLHDLPSKPGVKPSATALRQRPKGKISAPDRVDLRARGERGPVQGGRLANCKTCGREVHPERAEKYDYCTDPECQKRNARGLTIIAHGVNKAADQYQVLDEKIGDKVASGRWIEEKVSGTDLASRAPSPKRRVAAGRGPGERAKPAPPRPAQAAATRRRDPWTKAQLDLALIWNQRGMRPDEIAAKLGLSTWTVTQMLLSGRGRPKP